MRSCAKGSISLGTRSKNQPTLSVAVSSMGTRHSKWPPVNRQFGQRQVRPTVHSSLSSDWPSSTRRYVKPCSNSSKAILRWVGGRSPRMPLSARAQLPCSHSKCTGSIEFSWHWNQLHGISAKTICTKPLAQVKGSHVGTSGAGAGPRYAHTRPALTSTG